MYYNLKMNVTRQFLVVISLQYVVLDRIMLSHLHPCTFENAFDSFSGITVDECVKECNNRARCLSLSYNRYISHCVLRERVYIASEHKSTTRRCVIVNRDEIIASTENIISTGTTPSGIEETTKGPENATSENITALLSNCSNNGCDDQSVCADVVNNVTCTVAYCISETNISNAHFMSPVATKVGNRNTLGCDSDYTAFGKGSVLCTEDGTFEDTDFVCVQNCPSPPVKVGASIVTWSPRRFTENTTVTYTCTEGYYTFISPTIECKAGGLWSAFECTPACHHSNAPTVANGYLLPGDWYTVLDVGTYACSDGYYLSPGNPTIGCTSTGVWDSPAVSCYKHCTHVSHPVVDFGYMLPGDPYKEYNVGTYACHNGHYLSPGDPTVVCRSDGSWSFPGITCYTYCIQHTLPAVSNAVPVHGTDYNFTMSAEYDCLSLYYLSSGTAIDFSTLVTLRINITMICRKVVSSCLFIKT